MKPVEQAIVNKLSRDLDPSTLDVTNESFMHSVPEGSESHFKLVVVSEKFESKRLVQRHQMIYALLRDELAGPVHALAIHTYTSKEWHLKEQDAPDSPKCHGG
ncbi:MAG: BolA/IbaG family iron-sulfur metabolism protein [Porticoccaceae bacterium]|jgi:BolA protein|nr:BolA/IbaG family iron-sulfur metabolism protein [Porticoccaceae bacterium]MBT3799468.1 BolA/IbaG family iron-sulfur metabolism protein [Porticoccaceae bacterium]MBT4164476.1 BolA/IbaG family iron-sulfur metabolism protein [Porticoccaceae bacterium]MBT4210935.1 BolA/IbaG family iron-sulfur metabolism protein [Porticoccaceae bacterium]MBT4590956.1 BolA/IbaG family iron-sulfur metabolism protein [Porticoccaceae bacterium]